MPAFVCDESLVGQMPLTARREATWNDTEEEETKCEALLPFT